MVVVAPPKLVPPPGCARRAEIDPAEIERLQRFAAIPDGFTDWEQRDCFPRRLDDPTLARTVGPAGTIVEIAGKDAVVRDPGSSWLTECGAAGLPASGSQQVTGSDLLATIDRIASTPDLAAADIREIGLAKGLRAQGGGPLYALMLGTPRTVVRVQCFEDIESMVQRAATAMMQAQRVAQ